MTRAWNIDRTGGTFDSGRAGGLHPSCASPVPSVPTTSKVWARRLVVDAARSPDEPVMPVTSSRPMPSLLDEQGRILSEVMLFGMDGILLVGQPGEVFSETAARLRTRLRLLGYESPWLVTYANGSIGYLPEPEAFEEGGYEPTSPTLRGISRYYQQRVWEAVRAALP